MYMYIYKLYMPLYMKMSENINETARHETKSVKTIYNQIN